MQHKCKVTVLRKEKNESRNVLRGAVAACSADLLLSDSLFLLLIYALRLDILL